MAAVPSGPSLDFTPHYTQIKKMNYVRKLMHSGLWTSFAFDWTRITLQYAIPEGAKDPDSLSGW
jgi:hypothetical protein